MYAQSALSPEDQHRRGLHFRSLKEEEGEAARALLDLHPSSSKSSDRLATCVAPGSPPPLMTSAQGSPMTAIAPLDHASSTTVKPIHSVLPTTAGMVPQISSAGMTPQKFYVVSAATLPQYPPAGSIVTIVPYPGQAAAHQQQHHHAYQNAAAVFHHPGLNRPALPHAAAVPHRHQDPISTGAWRPTVVAGPTYYPPSMISSGSSTEQTIYPVRKVKSARHVRAPRSRLSSSDTSGYHTPSTDSDGFGILEHTKQLLTPPNTEGELSVKVERIHHPAPQSPASSCSDEEINVNVVDDSEDEMEDFCEEVQVEEGGSGVSKKFICNVCCDAFTTMTELRGHHRQQHVQKRPYKCDQCDKSFQHPYSLRVHRRSQHNDVSACSMFPCEHCTREFASAASLRVHARMHTGERPYQCRICNKTFMRSHQLKMHERVHTGNKPHECQICGKSFTQFKYLKEHCQRHAGYLPHQCNICNKAFLRPSHLKKHMRVHSADCAGCSCPICDYVFDGPSGLQEMQHHLATQCCPSVAAAHQQ